MPISLSFAHLSFSSYISRSAGNVHNVSHWQLIALFPRVRRALVFDGLWRKGEKDYSEFDCRGIIKYLETWDALGGAEGRSMRVRAQEARAKSSTANDESLAADIACKAGEIAARTASWSISMGSSPEQRGLSSCGPLALIAMHFVLCGLENDLFYSETAADTARQRIALALLQRNSPDIVVIDP